MKEIPTVCVHMCGVYAYEHICTSVWYICVCECVCVCLQSEYLRKEDMENPLRFISPLSPREPLRLHWH